MCWLFRPHFLPILSFRANVLSMREARTEMTKGVLESCWYEYEYTSYLSFLGEIMAIFDEKSIFDGHPIEFETNEKMGFFFFFGFENVMIKVIYMHTRLK